MKTTKILTILVLAFGLIVCLPKVGQAEAMGTAFTYQGRLIDANNAADGLYDLQFKLYDANVAGTQKGSTINIGELDVIDGYFTVALGFGSVFDGNARWLEIGVRAGELNDPKVYIVLSPRQCVSPTPYAIYAQTAGGVPSGLTGSGSANYIAKFIGSSAIGNSVIYESAGNVGIGTTSPSEKLTVYGGTIMATNSLLEGKGIYGVSSYTGTIYDNPNYGGYFVAAGGHGVGVCGWASNYDGYYNTGGDFSSGGSHGRGVAGWASGYYGSAVFGYAVHETGINYGVYGRTNSPNGYAGFFEGGRNYFQGNVGIGTTNPARNLHVSDVMRLQPRAAAPSSPAEGDIYMDSTDHKLKVYDGTTWKACW
jgi:hypothetical protein